MDKVQTAKEREKQIKKLLDASTPEEQRRIRQRDDEGQCWRKELEELEKCR